MPTIGQPNFALAGSNLAFALGNFDRDNFLPLVFIREEDALDIAFRFAAIGHVYFSLRLRITQGAIVRTGMRCPQCIAQSPAGVPPDICTFRASRGH